MEKQHFAYTEQPLANTYGGLGAPECPEPEKTPQLNLDPILDLDFYYIWSTGSTSRMATDVQGQRLFSMTEVYLPSNPERVFGYLNFMDEAGDQFLRAEHTEFGTRVINTAAGGAEETGSAVHLGTVDEMGRYGSARMHINSATGLGRVVLKPISGSFTSCCLCLTWCVGSVSKMDITLNGYPVGEITHVSGKTAVRLRPGLDIRAKALVVVGSFMLFNTYWQNDY